MIKKVSLGELIEDFESGSRPKGNSDDIPSLGGQHINSDGTLNLNNMRYISNENYNKYKKGRICTNDILIVKDGATTGKVAFIDSSFPFENATINEHLFRLKINQQKVIPKYVYLFLNSNIGKQEILKDFRGATVGGISKKFIETTQIPYISNLKAQEKVVNTLDKLNNIIQLRKQQITALSNLKQSIFYDMFGDPLVNDNKYPLKQLESICEKILGGGTPKKANPEYYLGNIPWVTPKDMKVDYLTDSIDHINDLAVENSAAKLIPKHSLLMVIRSGILKNKLPIAINEKEVCVNQDMKAFVTDQNQVLPEYLFFYFKAIEKKLLSSVRSVTADNLEFKTIKNLSVPLPPIEEQKKFSQKISKVITVEKKNTLYVQQLDLLYGALMQKAFKGEFF